MDYPVIDPVGTGSNIRTLIRNSGNTITGVGRLLGLADMSTMYKWLRGDALPGIDNILALSILLNFSSNYILVTKEGHQTWICGANGKHGGLQTLRFRIIPERIC